MYSMSARVLGSLKDFCKIQPPLPLSTASKAS